MIHLMRVVFLRCGLLTTTLGASLAGFARVTSVVAFEIRTYSRRKRSQRSAADKCFGLKARKFEKIGERELALFQATLSEPDYAAFDLLSRAFFSFARGFPRSLRGCGGTCTNCPNRGGTAAAVTIGPAATSFFRRESICRFRPSNARAPSSWRSPLSAKTTSSTVSALFTRSTA